MEQSLEQLEQAKGTTPNDLVATGIPPDTTEATITKFLQDVLLQESVTRQVTQIRCTTDPTTHAFLTLNRKSERNHSVKQLRRRPARGRDNSMRTSHGKNEASTNNLDTRSGISTGRWASTSRRSSSTEQPNQITESVTRNCGENG